MSLAGGIADKFGNRYEGRWTVAQVARVMADDVRSIVLEPPDGEAIEFSLLRTDGVTEHHQVKRSALHGSWSLGSLAKEGLLDAMVRWTEDGNEFHLVSPAPVYKELLALVDKARLATNYETFESGLGDDARTSFEDLIRRLPSSTAESTWSALRRVAFRQVDERTATEVADSRLKFLLEDDPAVARAIIGDLLPDNLRALLSGTDLWRLVEGKVTPRSFAKDATVRATVDRHRERYLSRLDTMTIDGQVVRRAQTDEIVGLIRDVNGPPRVLLSAAAGMGKSVVVGAVALQLSDELLVLPLSLADVPNASDASTVGAAMGLPASPAIVLAQLAAGGPALLVIDQVDVASEVSGRTPDLFRAVDEMVRELGDHPNVRVLMACRTFDLTSDSRLRRLGVAAGTHSVSLGPLDHAEVVSVLDALQKHAADITGTQREVLRVPLHLRLFVEAGEASGFATSLDLFRAYWAAKCRAVQRRGGQVELANEVVGKLADEMSSRQVLRVPRMVVDHLAETDALLSEHVIDGDQNLEFFHEAFFDFAFARAFIMRGQPLLDFLAATDQGLFRRSQLRQILAYQRVADATSYARDLQSVLTDARIRPHLKAMIMDLLRSVPDATDVEWNAIAAVIGAEDEPLRRRALGVLAASPSMFDHADAAGVMDRWIADGGQADTAASVLTSMQRFRPARVAKLLAGVDCTDPEWRRRMVDVAAHADLALDESFLEFFLGLVERGCLDELKTPFAANGSFWDLAHGLIETHPGWAARFIGAFVRRCMASQPLEDEHRPEAVPVPTASVGDRVAKGLLRRLVDRAVQFIAAFTQRPTATLPSEAEDEPRSTPTPTEVAERVEESLYQRLFPRRPFDAVPDPLDEGMFEKVGRTAPSDYLAAVLPIFLEFVGDGQPEADGRLTSRSWSRRRFFDSHHGVADGLRSGLEEALGSIARDDPVAFGAARQQLIAARAVVADDLLARAYTASPEPYAADVLAWIRDNPRRLGIGYVDSPYWRGRELVAAIWPFLDEDGRSGLEEVLTTFYPDHERTKEGRRYRGDAQFTLLDGLPSTGLSISAKTRLGELQRKFGAATPPHRTSAGFVESPIPASAIKHMSDSQWIEAMRQYGSDDMRARGESGMVGGLFQVSAQLRDATTRDPSRFISLAEQLPGEVSPEYLDAILRGASSAEDVPVEQMLGLVRLAHAVPNRPYGQPICDAVAKHADPGDLPPDIVEAIAWYATDGPESEPEREPIDDDHQDARTHLLSQGMGTDRGRAALAIARLIYRGSPLAYWRGTIERLVDEQSQPVLACVAETLLASLRHDRPWVAGLVPAVMAGMPEVASSVYAESLLKHLTPTHPNTTLPVIAELERSSAPAVSRVGGRLAALAVLAQVETRSMDHLATCASPGGRLGVAEVCAANISDPALSDACRAGLLELMSDSEEEVRREVGTAFRTLIDKPLGGERGLIDAFLASPAFPESPDSLLDALLAAPELLSPQNLVACNGLIDVVASDGSKPWRSFSVMPDVAALAIRTYVHGGADTRSGALDVVDRLSVLGVYGYESALAEFER